MLPCSTLRHVWVPKRAKHNASWTTCTGCVQDTRVFLYLFSTGEFFMAKGNKKTAHPCQLLAFETPPGAFSRFNLSNGRVPNPTGPGPREMPCLFSTPVGGGPSPILARGAVLQYQILRRCKQWKYDEHDFKKWCNLWKINRQPWLNQFYCHNICMNSINNFQHYRVAKGCISASRSVRTMAWTSQFPP